MDQMTLEHGWARSKPPTQPIELELIDKIYLNIYILIFK